MKNKRPVDEQGILWLLKDAAGRVLQKCDLKNVTSKM
jgi:hypothetical protein